MSARTSLVPTSFRLIPIDPRLFGDFCQYTIDVKQSEAGGARTRIFRISVSSLNHGVSTATGSYYSCMSRIFKYKCTYDNTRGKPIGRLYLFVGKVLRGEVELSDGARFGIRATSTDVPHVFGSASHQLVRKPLEDFVSPIPPPLPPPHVIIISDDDDDVVFDEPESDKSDCHDSDIDTEDLLGVEDGGVDDDDDVGGDLDIEFMLEQGREIQDAMLEAEEWKDSDDDDNDGVFKPFPSFGSDSDPLFAEDFGAKRLPDLFPSFGFDSNPLPADLGKSAFEPFDPFDPLATPYFDSEMVVDPRFTTGRWDM